MDTFTRLGHAIVCLCFGIGLLAAQPTISAAALQTPTTATRLPPPAPMPMPQVVGGGPVAPSSWPWLAVLVHTRITTTTMAFCGGTLIAPEWILTAHHCTLDRTGRPKAPRDIAVILGRADLRSDTGERSEVTEIRRHPWANQARAFDADIALLRLAQPSTRPPLALDQPYASLIQPGIRATVIGWGDRSLIGNAPDFPQVAQQVEVPVLEPAACSASYDGLITPGMVCMGDAVGGKGSCFGDSGGPWVVRDQGGNWRQIGLDSWGDSAYCGAPLFPSVATRTAPYTDWIAAQVSGQPYLGVIAIAPTVQHPGTPLTYRLRVLQANLPTALVGGYVVTATLPTGARLLSSTGASVAGTTLHWTIGQIQPNQAVERSFTVTSTTSLQLMQYGVVGLERAAQGSYQPETRINVPVARTLNTGPERARVGVPIAYTFVVENVGRGMGATAQQAVLEARLPADVSGVVPSDNGVVADGVVRWVIPTLAPGLPVVRTLQVVPQRAGVLWFNDYSMRLPGQSPTHGSRAVQTLVEDEGQATPTVTLIIGPSATIVPAPTQTSSPTTTAYPAPPQQYLPTVVR